MKIKTSLQRTTHSSGLSRLVPWITALGCAFSFGMTASAGIIPGQYLIRTKSKTDSDQFEMKHGLKAAFKFEKKKNRPNRTLSVKLNRGQLLKFMKDRDVDVIVPDRSFSIANAEFWRIESGGEGGWGYEQPQVVPAGVNRIGAYGLTYTGAGVGVAVVDTGLDLLHTDLAPISPISFSAFGGSAQDDHGHGTHVGGIIAARNNAVDVVATAHVSGIAALLQQSVNGMFSPLEIRNLILSLADPIPNAASEPAGARGQVEPQSHEPSATGAEPLSIGYPMSR